MEAKVIKVLEDGMTLIINKGRKDGIKKGMKFKVFERTNEKLYDPDTGEFLGILELPKGIGEIVEVEERYSFLESRNYERKETEINIPPIFRGVEEYIKMLHGEKRIEIIHKPFKNPKVGDIAILVENTAT